VNGLVLRGTHNYFVVAIGTSKRPYSEIGDELDLKPYRKVLNMEILHAMH